MNRRFFCEEIPSVGEVATLTPDEAHHLRTVLRAQAGEDVVLMDGAGVRARATVLPSAGRSGPVRCQVLEREVVAEPAVKPVLVVAPPRHKQMAQVVRQATELGAWELIPLLTERGVARPESTALAGWRQEARDAGKQSGNPFVPRCHGPMALTDALNLASCPGYVGAVPVAGVESVAPPVTVDLAMAGGRVALWIGPEGGFTEAELGRLWQRNLQPLVLGPWTLRVETAVVAGLSWLNGTYRR